MERSSTTPGGSARREATRQKLYEAAVTLIAEQGFSATTVDEIAERAGVAKGTVYYNFASKSVLFEELLRHGVGLLTASLREAAERTAREGGTKVDALDAMIRAGLGGAGFGEAGRAQREGREGVGGAVAGGRLG
ncbi:TetR family transcriptional regulator, partial [Streptomyces albogriseolus]|uniref:TetR/AcrR family transcriptional regulator n=1 Tax=Streptomyces albogriseolus TaxID=1887 RepID=UPI003460BB82